MIEYRPRARSGEARKPAHGTRARYYFPSDPCSCERCRKANALYQRRRRVPERAVVQLGLFDSSDPVPA
jgi:hypothetical protein